MKAVCGQEYAELMLGFVKKQSAFGEYADSKGPDQTAQMCSLIRALAVLLQNHLTLQNVLIESKCPDETLGMHRRI